MKLGFLVGAVAAVALGGLAFEQARQKHTVANAEPVQMHSTLPAVDMAKAVLNSTHRHREWVNVPFGSAGIRAFVVYPERSDKAPVVVLTQKKQSASDWIRAVGDQLAAEGYIAVMPDVLSGLAPNGGDADSFPNAASIAAAMEHMDPSELSRRADAAREFAVTLPAASGVSAALQFDTDSRIVASYGNERASFAAASSDSWRQAVSFLNHETGNRPVVGSNPNVPEDHSAHIAMAMAQNKGGQEKGGGFGGRGYPTGKLPDLPAGVFNAHSTLVSLSVTLSCTPGSSIRKATARLRSF